MRAVAEGRDPYAVSVGSVCTPDPLTLAPDDPVASAVALMREHAVRRIPVVEGGLPVGLVTLGDLAEARTRVGARRHQPGGPRHGGLTDQEQLTNEDSGTTNRRRDVAPSCASHF